MGQRTVEYAKRLNWNKVANDYLLYRNGYPASFFSRLKKLGIGLPKQSILDLGTGTGALAIPFAQQGALVTGVDPAEGQIEAAYQRSRVMGLWVNLLISPAEDTGLPDHAYDVVTASMCWGYIDKKTGAAEVSRLLKPKGLFLISSIHWSAEDGSVAEKTNDLIASYNPDYGKKNSTEDKSYGLPEWAEGYFKRPIRENYVEAISFSKEAWLGRIRASKWIGASLLPGEVEAFDREHRELLKGEPEEFQIIHRIKMEIFQSV